MYPNTNQNPKPRPQLNPGSPNPGSNAAPVPVPDRTAVGDALIGLTESQRLARVAEQRVVDAVKRNPEVAVEQYPAVLIITEFVSARLDTQDTALGRIEEQTKKTNGRVSALEGWRDYWLAFFAGVIAVLTIVGILVVDRVTDIVKEQIRIIIREEINAPSHIHKLKSHLRPPASDDQNPQLARQP